MERTKKAILFVLFWLAVIAVIALAAGYYDNIPLYDGMGPSWFLNAPRVFVWENYREISWALLAIAAFARLLGQVSVVSGLEDVALIGSFRELAFLGLVLFMGAGFQNPQGDKLNWKQRMEEVVIPNAVDWHVRSYNSTIELTDNRVARAIEDGVGTKLPNVSAPAPAKWLFWLLLGVLSLGLLSRIGLRVKAKVWGGLIGTVIAFLLLQFFWPVLQEALPDWALPVMLTALALAGGIWLLATSKDFKAFLTFFKKGSGILVLVLLATSCGEREAKTTGPEGEPNSPQTEESAAEQGPTINGIAVVEPGSECSQADIGKHAYSSQGGECLCTDQGRYVAPIWEAIAAEENRLPPRPETEEEKPAVVEPPAERPKSYGPSPSTSARTPTAPTAPATGGQLDFDMVTGEAWTMQVASYTTEDAARADAAGRRFPAEVWQKPTPEGVRYAVIWRAAFSSRKAARDAARGEGIRDGFPVEISGIVLDKTYR